MSPFKTVLLISIIFGFCGTVFGGYFWWFGILESSIKGFSDYLSVGLISLASGLTIGGMMGVIIDATILKHIDAKSILLKEKPVIFSEATCLWKWDQRLKDSPILSYKEMEITVSMAGFHPLTPNPKIRDLSCKIIIKALGTPEKFLQCLTAKVWDVGMENWLRYHLYEFNEARSREIAVFYNPCDDKQQSNFEKLVRDFLEPHLANTGLEFADAHFNLP